MERLTFEGNFCDIAQCRELPCPYDGGCAQKEVWERLKAYEDRGREPEEILPKSKACEIALNLMRLAGLESLCSYDHLRELAEADKDGRLVVLPCKAGTPVWRIAWTFATYPDKSKQYVRNDTFFLSDLIEFGKTVFLTREEAEKALQEME